MAHSTLDKDKTYRDFYNKVTRYVRKSISNQDDVEDLVSDIFVKVFSKLDTYDKRKASLSTWIYTISSNVVIDYFRKNRKFSVVSVDSPEEEYLYGSASYDKIDKELLKNETLSILAEALDNLEEREVDLIVLRYYKKETLKSIATMMNISYSNAKLIHKKALERLKEYFTL